MNLSIAIGGQITGEMYSGAVKFADASPNDTFKAIAMRPGFQFNSALHSYLRNVKTTTGVISAPDVQISAVNRWIKRLDGGNFGVDGFKTGNYITCAGSGTHATGLYKITKLAISKLTLAIVGGVLEDYVPTTHADPDHDISISSDDELKAISATISIEAAAAGSTFTRASGDFINDGFMPNARFTINNGTNAGQFTVAAVSPLVLTVNETVVDETNAAMEFANGYLGEHAVTFFSTGNSLYMHHFDPEAVFGLSPILDYSPGCLIYNDTHPDDVVVCYAEFVDWAILF